MFLEVSFICEKSSLAKSLINNPGKPILIELSTFGFMGGFGTAAFLDKKRIPGYQVVDSSNCRKS